MTKKKRFSAHQILRIQGILDKVIVTRTSRQMYRVHVYFCGVCGDMIASRTRREAIAIALRVAKHLKIL